MLIQLKSLLLPMFTIGVICHLAAVKLKVEPPCPNIPLEYAMQTSTLLIKIKAE